MRYSSASHTHTIFFSYPSPFSSSLLLDTWKWRANEHVPSTKYFSSSALWCDCLCLFYFRFGCMCIRSSVASSFFNLSKRCLRCSIVIVFFHCGNETMKKKLSVDSMRPPAATSFVIFLSSNSHFRMLLLSSLSLSLLFFSLSIAHSLFAQIDYWILQTKGAKRSGECCCKEAEKKWDKKYTCLLVVSSCSSCSINCNVAFVYLHVVSTAATAIAAAVAVHLITQLSGLCKVHVVWSTFFLLLLHRNHFAVKTM